MLRWKKNILFIEKNGLVFVVIAIILFYWTIDIITEGRLMSRLMITISLLVYGIFAQFLIDAQKAAKDSLRDSEEQHRLLIEKLPFAIFVDIQGKIVYVNPSFLTLFKVSSRDEVIGKRLENFSPLELFDSLKEGRRTLEVNIRRMDGAVITVFSTPMPITFDRQPATLVAISDITERKQMEEALRES
jgi:PAS domain S-box-containing protein